MDILNNQEEIYEQFRPKVFSYLYYKINDYYEAEDITEDVFLKVFKRLDTFDETKLSLNTWIFNITKNTLIDYYRTKKDSLELLDNYEYVDEHQNDVDPLMVNDLANALDTLPELQKDIIVLRYYENYTLKEIAEKLSISYGVCKLRHNEALNSLKQKISL